MIVSIDSKSKNMIVNIDSKSENMIVCTSKNMIICTESKSESSKQNTTDSIHQKSVKDKLNMTQNIDHKRGLEMLHL